MATTDVLQLSLTRGPLPTGPGGAPLALPAGSLCGWGVLPPAPGPEHLLSARRMEVLLGPLAGQLHSAGVLVSAMCDISDMWVGRAGLAALERQECRMQGNCELIKQLYMQGVGPYACKRLAG